MQSGSRGSWSTTTETFAVYPSSGGVPQAQQPREGIGLVGLVLWVDRRGAGERMASRGRLGPFQRFLYLGGELGVCGFECRGLGSGAVRSGLRRGLRLWVWSAVSVA
jgi:hypothetical protein